jgi:hypothetical protein
MFVVQLKRPGEDPDLRAFGSRRAAVARFRTAQTEMIEGRGRGMRPGRGRRA